MQHGQVQYQIAWPRPGRALIGIIVANVVAYVLQLVLLRANAHEVTLLYLRPRDVLVDGYVWQTVTYWWMHDPASPSHLLFNMLMLWIFGSRLENRWGERRFLIAYGIFGFGGSVLVLIMGLLSQTGPFASLLAGAWGAAHLGASGAVTGMTVAWGLTYAEEEFQFLLLGRMKGKTLVLLVVAFDLLVALSFANTSSSSHFGGIIAAFLLVQGLWRPSRWSDLWRREKLKVKKRRIERQLRVIEGSKESEPSDPSKWN